MRVYFVGSHGTGKTTLTRWVSLKWGLPMVSEVARGVLATLETNLGALRMDIQKINEYQMQVARAQIIAESPLDKPGVFDRSFDHLAYAAEHSLAFNEIASILHEDYLKAVRAGFVFFIRPKYEVFMDAKQSKDSVRESLDWEGVVRIDGMIKLLLENLQIDYLPIETSSLQQRLKTVNYVLTRGCQHA